MDGEAIQVMVEPARVKQVEPLDYCTVRTLTSVHHCRQISIHHFLEVCDGYIPNLRDRRFIL